MILGGITMKTKIKMHSIKIISSLLAIVIALGATAQHSTLAASSLAVSSVSQEAILADFELGVDPRGSIGWNPGGLTVGGPSYAWHDPYDSQEVWDDINYWDVYSDGDGIDEPVDYELNFAPQDWRVYKALNIQWYAWSDGGGSGTRIEIWAYDADGTGNSGGNGFHFLGSFSSNGSPTNHSLSLSGMGNRDQVTKIKIRVLESFFGGVGVNGANGEPPCITLTPATV
jgi:hypothetical protein